MPKQSGSRKTSTPSLEVDFSVEHYGTVFLVHPQNENARLHLQGNVGHDAQWFGARLVVKPRFIGGLLSSLREKRWSVR